MKICFLTGDIFKFGGVQRVVSAISNELSNYHEIDIVCGDKNITIDRNMYNLKKEVNVVKLNGLKRNNLICKVLKAINKVTGIFNNNILYKILREIYFTPKTRKKIIKYLNDNSYDIIIGVEGYYTLLLGVISNEINSKIIGWQHNSYDAYLNNKYKYYWNQDILFKKYLTKLDKCILLTEEDSSLYKKKLNINCNVIYNPLSFESKIKSKCNNKSIIFVGRLVENQKGIDLLIEAFNLVHIKHKDWILRIVGNGPDKRKIIKKINEYNLQESIILVGETNSVEKFYLDSSIFISSSRWEGFGLVITEAMECGLPVIAFENSGPKEIIDKNNINGILVKRNDINKLAYEIIKLIEDQDKRKFISKNSIKRAKDFSINNIICKWNEVIN